MEKFGELLSETMDDTMRQVKRLLCAVFDSDSEYEWLLQIQTPISYKLNPTTLGTLT